MGNSAVIGDKHYNRMLDAHFDAATRPATQHMPAAPRETQQTDNPRSVLRGDS